MVLSFPLHPAGWRIDTRDGNLERISDNNYNWNRWPQFPDPGYFQNIPTCTFDNEGVCLGRALSSVRIYEAAQQFVILICSRIRARIRERCPATRQQQGTKWL